MRKILHNILQHPGTFLATLCMLFAFQFISAQKFVIPVLPDTQNEISGQLKMFTSQMNWIANNNKKLNISIVLHVGDIINWQTPDQMIKIHPNVCMVLSGHTDSTAWRDDVGTNGNHIYQMLQDYQGSNKGGGFIRLIEIDTKKRTISASMYSPFTNQTKTDFSQFAFSNVKFIRRKK
jgi:hypothetical protein